MPDPRQVVPVIFFIVGSVLVVVGLRDLRSQIAFHRRAVRCRGVVTDFRTRRSRGGSRSRKLYYPVLEFRTADGRDVQTEGRLGNSGRGFRPGQQVTVTYDPRDPSHAYPGSGAAATVLALFVTAFGGLFAVIGWSVLKANEVVAHLLGGG
jgi:Protein of unknown function (DUF3592)